MTHTEHVHILFGLGLALAGAGWLGALAYPGGPLRYIWPIPAFLVGVFLVISTETQERTYTEVGAWDTFLSVFPNSLAVWLATVKKVHVIQHKAAGVCALAAGGIEWGRAVGCLSSPRWRWFFPFLAIAAGLALGVHGGTHQHLPRLSEQLHHWILGGVLVAGGTVLVLALARVLKGPGWHYVLPALMLIAGVDLMLFYRVT
jgi:hypothetical protein